MNDYEQQASIVDVTSEVDDALCEIEELVSGPHDKATQCNFKVKYRTTLRIHVLFKMFPSNFRISGILYWTGIQVDLPSTKDAFTQWDRKCSTALPLYVVLSKSSAGSDGDYSPVDELDQDLDLEEEPSKLVK